MALQRIAELEKGDDDERSDGPRRKRRYCGNAFTQKSSFSKRRKLNSGDGLSISAGRVADVKDFEDQIKELNMQIQEREKKVKRVTDMLHQKVT